MRKQTIIGVTLLLALLLSAAPVFAAVDINAALDYLKTQQNADGGFGSGFSPGSTLSATADTVLAIVAAGGDLSDFEQGSNTPLTYLESQAPSATTGGDLSKLILAAIAAGQNPRQFGGVDSVAKLESLIGADGKIGTATDTFVAHTLAILALKSAQRPIPAMAVQYVKGAQQESGGWAWDGTAATAVDTNTTAFALQALVAAGEAGSSEAVTRALAYYQGIQNEDGGWPYQNPSDFGTTTDANSTAVTIQAILAAGQAPDSADWTTAQDKTPIAALEALQNPSGGFAWQATVPGDNLLATVQALPALAGKAFPFATMNVGEAASPVALPQTGGAALNLSAILLLTGLALAGGGYALRRRATR
jgi:prenyltransferase beta subunit